MKYKTLYKSQLDSIPKYLYKYCTHAIAVYSAIVTKFIVMDSILRFRIPENEYFKLLLSDNTELYKLKDILPSRSEVLYRLHTTRFSNMEISFSKHL